VRPAFRWRGFPVAGRERAVIEKKPGRNLPAIAIVALVVMYVGSYLVIRSQSAQFSLGSASKVDPIFFGFNRYILISGGRTVIILGTIYFPLVKADRLLTGRDVLVFRSGGASSDPDRWE
jgi:hypothetical protein